MFRTIRLLTTVATFATALMGAAQAQFNNIRHDFGTIIWQTPVSAEFTVTNQGDSPMTILSVRPDCGCTSAEWTQTPIAPGAKGKISITYDAALLGHFEKQIAVQISHSEKETRLILSGDVVMERKDNAARYPYRIGDIYIDSDNMEFDDVYRGDMPQKALQVYNSGRQSYEPELMHLPKYLTCVSEPQVIRPGRTGRILITLNSNQLRNYGLTQTSIYLSRFQGDRVNSENEIGISATLLPEPVSSENVMANAPKAQLDSTVLHLGSLGGKKQLKRTVTLTNAGKSTLEINTLQVYNPGIRASLAKRTLQPGESTKLKIAVHSTSHTFKGRRRVLIITNDPANPKIVVDIHVKK